MRLFLLVAILLISGLNLGEITAQVRVRTTGAVNQEILLNGSARVIGSKLKQILGEQLPDRTDCLVWSHRPLDILASNISTQASSLNLVFHNVTIKAPDDTPFDYVISIGGRRTTVNGLKVDGNGPAIDAKKGGNAGRGEGIRVAGANCMLVNCRASNMPNGFSANCFFVAGEYADLFRCQGVNPGYACFRNVANNATYDQVESFINRPTANKKNRLFNLDSTRAAKGGSVIVRNSYFHANFSDPNVPPELREVVLNIDPGDEDDKGLDKFAIENCLIELGPTVRSLANHHVFKIKNVTDSRLIRLNVRTPENYAGWALRLQKTQADIEMSCELEGCAWDQGINFDAKLKTMKITNCMLGKASAYSNELLNDVNFPELMTIRNCQLVHAISLANLRANNTQCRLILNNVKFWSNTRDLNTHVFRSNVPVRASYFTAVNFNYAKLPSADPAHRLWLAYSPATRLALSSRGDRGATMVFDPGKGVSASTKSPTNSDQIPGPPFNEFDTEDGAKIYLATGADPNQHGWQQANYWERNSKTKNWLPVGN